MRVLKVGIIVKYESNLKTTGYLVVTTVQPNKLRVIMYRKLCNTRLTENRIKKITIN